MQEEIVIGIDFGTSNSVACVYIDGEPIFIPSSDGINMDDPSFPNYVAFTDNEILVGEAAKRRFVSHPGDVVHINIWKMGENGKREYKGKLYSPQLIAAFIFRKIKRDAETYLNRPVDNAIIAVPAYFDDNQRTATKDAARIAGFNVIELIKEPVAASLAYGIGNETYGKQRILVFDMGSGTLDVTVMEHGVNFEVKSTSGDSFLGVTDMDNVLSDFLAREFEKQHGVKLNFTKKLKNRLIDAAVRARKELSHVYETDVVLPFMGMDSNGNALDLQVTITRNQFDKLVRPIVERCKGPIQSALDDADLTVNDIEELVFVGESSKIPVVRNFVQNFIGITADEIANPVTCVAQGAAIKGSIINMAFDPIPDDVTVEPIDKLEYKEIFSNQIEEMEKIVYFSKKYIYESDFEEKIMDLNLDEINELINILKDEIIK